ncbi:MAG: nicotinamide-nucleotide adenylyltransferase [Candidatus Bathyarchaeia archaeon]
MHISASGIANDKSHLQSTSKDAWGIAMVNRGLYVGRFQPFHLGHLEATKEVLKEVDELVIVIGSAQYSHNLSNPFTAGERLVMIRRALQEANVDLSRVWIVPVPDVHLHMLWVSALEGYTPRFNVVYSNEPLTRRLFMEAGYKVKSIRFFQRNLYTSTIVREKMLKGENWTTMVPKSVAEFINEIDGVSRLRDLNKTDKI